MFYLFAACGAFGVLKELRLAAPFILAYPHKRFAAEIAFFSACKRLLFAERTNHHKRPAATSAKHITAFDRFQAGRAVITERASAPAFGAKTCIPHDKFATMYTWLFKCRHGFSSSCLRLNIIIPFSGIIYNSPFQTISRYLSGSVSPSDE